RIHDLPKRGWRGARLVERELLRAARAGPRRLPVRRGRGAGRRGRRLRDRRLMLMDGYFRKAEEYVDTAVRVQGSVSEETETLHLRYAQVYATLALAQAQLKTGDLVTVKLADGRIMDVFLESGAVQVYTADKRGGYEIKLPTHAKVVDQMDNSRR